MKYLTCLLLGWILIACGAKNTKSEEAGLKNLQYIPGKDMYIKEDTINISKQFVTISITKDLKYFINNKPVLIEDLPGMLTSSVKGIKEPMAVLRIDKSIPVQEIVAVLDIGQKQKVKMILATDVGK